MAVDDYLHFCCCSRLWLMLLILFFFAFGYIEMSEERVFNGVEVFASRLTSDNRLEEIPAPSITLCAIIATFKKPWSHLICHADNVCKFSDVLVGKGHKDDPVTSGEEVIKCITDVGTGCMYDTGFALVGERFITPSDCFTRVCTGLNQYQYAFPGPIVTCQDATFVQGVGCYTLHNSSPLVKYNEARAACIGLGADLPQSHNYEPLRDYLFCRDEVERLWLTIIGGDWRDGAPVEDRFWEPGIVPDPTKCGYLQQFGESKIRNCPCNTCIASYICIY